MEAIAERKKRLDFDDTRDDIIVSFRNSALLLFAIVAALLSIGAIRGAVKHDATHIHPIGGNWSFLYVGKGHFKCKDDTALENETLPSLLRVLELRIEIDVLFRIAVLLPITFVVFAAYTNGERTLALNPGHNILTKTAIRFIPFVSLAHFTSLGVFITMNIIIDSDYNHDLMLRITSYLSILYMISYVVLDSYDRTRGLSSTLRFKVRLMCAVVNVCFFTSVHRGFLPYLHEALCHPYVTSGTAITEYCYIAVHLAFYLSTVFDFDDLELLLSANTPINVIEEFKSVYKPNVASYGKVFPSDIPL